MTINLPLHCKSCDRAGGSINPQILKVRYAETASMTVDPCPSQTVCNVGQTSRHQDHQVGYSQTDQIAVGRCPHITSDENHQDYHDVAYYADTTNEKNQEDGDGLVLDHAKHDIVVGQRDVGWAVHFTAILHLGRKCLARAQALVTMRSSCQAVCVKKKRKSWRLEAEGINEAMRSRSLVRPTAGKKNKKNGVLNFYKYTV